MSELELPTLGGFTPVDPPSSPGLAGASDLTALEERLLGIVQSSMASQERRLNQLMFVLLIGGLANTVLVASLVGANLAVSVAGVRISSGVPADVAMEAVPGGALMLPSSAEVDDPADVAGDELETAADSRAP